MKYYKNYTFKKMIKNLNFNSNEKREIISKDKAFEQIIKLNEFVIKPTIGGSSGNSVKIINLEKLNKALKLKKVSEVLEKYNSNYIVQSKILANEEFNNIYPNSVNTVRPITYIVDEQIFHAPLSFRMGSGNNDVDNILAGGIVVSLSDEGYLGRVGYQLGYGDSKVKYEKHPNSGIEFDGYQISSTRDMNKLAYNLHSHTPI